MSIADSIEQMIERFGNTVTITMNQEEPKKTKAFIQPLRYKNKMYIDGNFLPGGYIDGGHYLYIGLPQFRLDKSSGDTVITTAQGEPFMVKRAELYAFTDTPVYVWAILTPYEKEWQL